MTITALLEAATNLPVVGKGASWILHKKRLLIEYLLLGFSIAIGGLAFSLWLTRAEVRQELATVSTELAVVNGRVGIIEMQNAQLKTAADKLRLMREEDSRAMNALLKELETLSKQDLEVREKLHELETTNEAVRDLRKRPIPPELNCVLEPTTCQD